MTSTVAQAARSLTRSPGFSITAILSIATGVGLACSVFANVQAAVFPDLPFPDPETLVEIWPTANPGSQQPVDYLRPERMLDWAGTDMRFLQGVSGRGLGAPLLLQSDGGATEVSVEPIVGDWFATMGVNAARGRTLIADDLRPDAPPAAVVSYAMWQSRLGRDDRFPGAAITLAEATFTVVGVMPEAFERRERVWVAAEALPAALRPVAYSAAARLRPGTSLEEAAAEVGRRAAAEAASDSVRFGGLGATVQPFGAFGAGATGSLWVLAGVVIAVLLIGLTNLTHLFLVRAQQRTTSFALRVSLGARRRQLAGALLAESFVLAGLGGALGLLMAQGGKDLIQAVVPGTATEIRPGLGLLGVMVGFGLTALVGLVVGLGPLRRLQALDLQSLLRRGAAGATPTKGERRVQHLLLAGQVAASVVLVTTALTLGGVWRSFERLDVGYDARTIVRAVPDWEARGTDADGQWALARQVGLRLAARPEVGGVALWRYVGMNWPPRPENEAVLDGLPIELGQLDRLAGYYEIEPGTLETLGVPLLRGRGFTREDGPGTSPIAIVSRSAAEAWWPGEDPLGHQLKMGEEGTWLTVVGVVEDLEGLGVLARETVTRGAVPQVFTPAAQDLGTPPGWHALGNCYLCDGVVIAAKGFGDVSAAARALRDEIALADPGLTLSTLRTLFDEQTSTDFYQEQLLVPGRLATSGGVVALLLAVIGVAGVIAEAVARRTREIGVRAALGARATLILLTVSADSLRATFLGLVAGLVIVSSAQGFLVRSVYHYLVLRLSGDTVQPSMLAGGAVSVLAVVLAVTLWTARGALRVDPVEALRAE